MAQSRSRIAPTVLILALLLSVLPLALTSAEAAPLVPASSNVGCDPLDAAACLLPFPSDHFTTADATTATGRRVNFLPTAMPRNGTEVTEGGEGKPVDPIEWNRNDGFSPGSPVMTYVPGLDLHATWGTQDRPHSEVGPNEIGYFDHRDHIADISLYEREDAPIVIINAETGERHPFWSELDTHRDAVAAGEQVLIMRPAVNFEEGARYVVGLRNLKTTDGTAIEPGAEFLAYRGGTGADAVRQAHFNDSVFPALQTAGIDRNELYLAWDFTVASERNLAERILHMRDDAFEQLGDTELADGIVQGSSPEFTIDSVELLDPDSWTDSNGRAFTRPMREIQGRVTVPNYMDRIQQTEGHVRANELPADAPAPGSRLLDTNLDGLPDQNPVESTVNVPFTCRLPLDGEQKAPVLYGHGLLGDRSQINDATRSPLRDGPFFSCAADWWGMSTPDAPTVAAILADFSNFPSLPDRAQQGFLNFMFLGRAAVHPEGFAADAAFKDDSGVSLVKTADENDTPLYYDGNSQGGIMGGSLVAVSPDIKRGILGVLGMNYSTLLNRSVDWEGELALEPNLPPYSVPFYAGYRDPVERQIVFGLMQMLWDRGEANGYAHHMTDDPLANTPPHEVLLQAAFSDHQVANVSAEVEARTIGAPLMVPSLAPGRHWEMEPYSVGTATYPYKGSALVYWDSGNATPPNGNIPPDQNGDPHGHPRSEPASSWQEAHFLLTGEMYDVCGGGFYLTDNNPTTGGITCHAPLWPAGSEPPVDPEPIATTVSVTEASQSSGQFSDATLFQARLADAADAPIAGRELVFELAGDGGARTFNATTDDNGLAMVTPILTERPGDYALTVSFAGTDDLAASTSEATGFVVEREDTSTLLEVTGQGSKRALRATVGDGDSGVGVEGVAVAFSGDGSDLGTSTTDLNGVAVLTLPARYRGGRHDFEARFGGNDFYLPSTGGTST
ncbi:MAG TPA: hypothetical protein VJ927_12045 [Actinomycetota bacterium]|nr:hypothetical protein [Actinomycetota bacterium]